MTKSGLAPKCVVCSPECCNSWAKPIFAADLNWTGRPVRLWGNTARPVTGAMDLLLRNGGFRSECPKRHSGARTQTFRFRPASLVRFAPSTSSRAATAYPESAHPFSSREHGLSLLAVCGFAAPTATRRRSPSSRSGIRTGPLGKVQSQASRSARHLAAMHPFFK
jgi:hypothetical protein